MRTYYDRGGDKAVVEVARDGLQVVEAFKNSREGELEAILMDIMMPNMDGIEATKTIRSLDRADAKSIPIIAMTANAFQEDAEKCIAAGMNAHLAKPLDIEKVKMTIYNIYKKSQQGGIDACLEKYIICTALLLRPMITSPCLMIR